MTIATTRGDGGQTGLAGGIRVSKDDLRVESYGSIDELNSVLGIRPQHLLSTRRFAAGQKAFNVLYSG